MSDEELDAEILGKVPIDRRTFVRRVILGAAFAVPVVASFAVADVVESSHRVGAAEPAFVSNQEPPRVGLPHLGKAGYLPYAYHPYEVGLDG